MRILITGATGFIGRHLIKALCHTDNLFIVTRTRKNLPEISYKNEFIFDDNIDELAKFIKTNCIEGVVHLATKYVAEHKNSDIKDLILSNLYFSTVILDASVSAGVKWFINIGTIWQNYNVPDYSDQYNPVNLYAATKQAFMTLAKFYTETTGIKFCTLKLCDTYGSGDTRRKIMDLFSEIAISGKTLDMSKGEQLIDILHIDEVVKTIINLINLLSDNSSHLGPEYVVTSGNPISLKALALKYEKDHNVKLNINWGGRPYRSREVMKPYKGNPVPL